MNIVFTALLSYLAAVHPDEGLPRRPRRGVSLFRHPGESRDPGASGKVPITWPWIPAFAGMTMEKVLLR